MSGWVKGKPQGASIAFLMSPRLVARRPTPSWLWVLRGYAAGLATAAALVAIL